jgi:ABC transporter substrate binding protein (PQQ-dependent alcohol dehydrogenase system)
MRSDAIAQTLVSRKWSKLLLLIGPNPKDQQRAATAQASIKRYGLQVVATKPFKLSTDPRERDLANPLLLTAGTAYDAVWIVDSDGEFARGLPYRTVLPRPVVGDAGLVALAWHAQFERYGAPQVSRRFFKAAKRPMTDRDWAAWMAGKTLLALASATPKGPNSAWAQALAKTSVDGSKGVNLSFRTWDGQLRQTMLLTDGQGVIAQAPIEGLLHPSNVPSLNVNLAAKLTGSLSFGINLLGTLSASSFFIRTTGFDLTGTIAASGQIVTGREGLLNGDRSARQMHGAGPPIYPCAGGAGADRASDGSAGSGHGVL